MAVSQLVSAGSGAIDQATLEKRCQLTAQRMTQLYGLNSPVTSIRRCSPISLGLLPPSARGDP